MHLVCPKCATSYQIDAASVGAGRSVRCTRCKNVWFAAAHLQSVAVDTARDEAAFREELGTDTGAASAATARPQEYLVPTAGTAGFDEPTLNTPPAITAAPTEPPSGASYLKSPPVDSPPLAPVAATSAPTIASEPEDVESVAARRMPASKVTPSQRTAPRSKLPLLILVLIAACAAIIGWRKDIVRHAPQMASLYRLLGMPVNVRGLIFNDIKLANETHDGVPVLTVEGTIVNVVPDAVQVPRLRFALRNGAGQEVYSWTAMPNQPVLPPGQTMPFRSGVASPPGDVQDVQVRFHDRRDAAADGR